MTMQDHSVKVGGEDFTVQRFKGLKAIMVMASLTRLAKEVPDILADVSKDYTQRRTVTITEAMSRLPRWDGFSKEDFDKAEADTGKREIELPAPMTTQDQVLVSLPPLLEKARKEVIRLLAILIIPNADLREADENDRVEDALDHYQTLLLYEADIDELVELVLVAQDVIQEQLTSDKRERLGNLFRSLRNALFPNRPTQTPTLETVAKELEDESESKSTQKTSTSSAQTSSTDSQSHTDGTETQLSTASHG
jgi:hypothetical protein